MPIFFDLNLKTKNDVLNRFCSWSAHQKLFQIHFGDFESARDRIRVFESPFTMEFETQLKEIGFEVVELIPINQFNECFKKNDLQQFLRHVARVVFSSKNVHVKRFSYSALMNTYL